MEALVANGASGAALLAVGAGDAGPATVPPRTGAPTAAAAAVASEPDGPTTGAENARRLDVDGAGEDAATEPDAGAVVVVVPVDRLDLVPVPDRCARARARRAARARAAAVFGAVVEEDPPANVVVVVGVASVGSDNEAFALWDFTLGGFGSRHQGEATRDEDDQHGQCSGQHCAGALSGKWFIAEQPEAPLPHDLSPLLHERAPSHPVARIRLTPSTAPQSDDGQAALRWEGVYRQAPSGNRARRRFRS